MFNACDIEYRIHFNKIPYPMLKHLLLPTYVQYKSILKCLYDKIYVKPMGFFGNPALLAVTD